MSPKLLWVFLTLSLSIHIPGPLTVFFHVVMSVWRQRKFPHEPDEGRKKDFPCGMRRRWAPEYQDNDNIPNRGLDWVEGEKEGETEGEKKEEGGIGFVCDQAGLLLRSYLTFSIRKNKKGKKKRKRLGH